jgi:hypothetical protein
MLEQYNAQHEDEGQCKHHQLEDVSDDEMLQEEEELAEKWAERTEIMSDVVTNDLDEPEKVEVQQVSSRYTGKPLDTVGFTSNPKDFTPSPQPKLWPSGHPFCAILLPKHYCDELPPPPVFAPEEVCQPNASDTIGSPSQPTENSALLPYVTDMNGYGVYCVYPQGCRSYTPDELYTLQQVSDSSTFAQQPCTSGLCSWWSLLGSSLNSLQENYFVPFLNASIFHLMTWFYGGSNLKSLGELNKLVNEVILANDFKRDDFVGFSASWESE